MAVRKLLEKEKAQELLDALNEAYSHEESVEEKTLREKGKKYYAQKVLTRHSRNQTGFRSPNYKCQIPMSNVRNSKS